MKHKLSTCVCLVILIAAHFNSLGQDAMERRKAANKLRPAYLEFGAGLNVSTFRDFATSPLMYKTLATDLSLFYQRMDEAKETRVGIDFIKGNYKSSVGDEAALSQVHTIKFTYWKLWQLKNMSNDKWNYKVGGTFMLTSNLRLNPSLQNATVGLESFNNLMVSGKVTRDLSRKNAKEGKFLFIKYNRKPVQRNLSYQLNIGVVNNNIRNGYTYINQKGVLNEFSLFGDYNFNFMSGFRMNSSLDYTVTLKNKNVYKFSYFWDMYTSGEDKNQFEASHHTIKFALLFNLREPK